MATILEFRASPRIGGLAMIATREARASAEIVFFPGVRYERVEEELPPAKPKKSKRRRDQLELED